MKEQLQKEISRVSVLQERAAVSFEGTIAQAMINAKLMQAHAALVSDSHNAMRISHDELAKIKG